MKDLKQIMGMLALLIISSISIGCTEECTEVHNEDRDGMITRTFTASFDKTTKTSIEEGGKVSWCKGDTIWYYTENYGELRYHIIKEDCRSADITVKMNEETRFIVAFYGDSDIAYNYYEMIGIKGLAGIYQDGSFGDAHLSVAQCLVNESSELIFKNLTSMIKFSLSRNDVHYISITSNDGKPLSHAEYHTDIYSDSLYICPTIETGDNTIYVHTGGAGTFYIGLMPIVMEKGFTIECYNKNMQYIGTVRSTKELSLEARQIINLGTLDERIYNHEFRIYHIYGPVPTPPTDPIPPVESEGNYTPIPPDSPDYQTDRTQHIYGDNNGNIATVRPDAKQHGYIITFGGDSNTEYGKQNTIVAHANTNGRLEYFIIKEQLYEVQYTDSGVCVSYTDSDNVYHDFNGYKDPYPTESATFVSRNAVGIYGSIVSPFIDLMMAFSSKDLASKLSGTAIAGLGIYNAWVENSFQEKMTTTIVAGATGIIMSSITGGPWWVAASGIKSIIDVSVMIVENHCDTMAKILYTNAYPITLEWEQNGRNSVILSCSVSNKSEFDEFNIGVIVGNNGIFLDKYLNDYQKFQKVENGTAKYEFTFTQLKPNRNYYYCAVIAPSDKHESNIYDYWRYGEVQEFKLSEYYLSEVDMGISVQWASCNLGASNPWEAGDYFTLSQAKEVEEKTGWRLPTEEEYIELFKCERKEKTINEINGVEIKSNGQTIFLPKVGRETMGYNNFGCYLSSTPHRNYGSAYIYCQYFTGTGYGWYWANPSERISVRLVKDY